jgi:ferredoxin
LPQAAIEHHRAVPALLWSMRNRRHSSFAHGRSRPGLVLARASHVSTARTASPRSGGTLQQALTTIGIDVTRVHTELFGALPASTPGLVGQTRRPPHQPPGPPGTGPRVTFARSGITTSFTASAHGVLELADACDVPARWSCRTGVCHTCVTPLLSGEITYSPDPLELPADGEVLICCSRPATDIVLDM